MLGEHVVVDRVRAGQYGVTLQSISDILNDAFAQRQISTIYAPANQYRLEFMLQAGYIAEQSVLKGETHGLFVEPRPAQDIDGLGRAVLGAFGVGRDLFSVQEIAVQPTGHLVILSAVNFNFARVSPTGAVQQERDDSAARDRYLRTREKLNQLLKDGQLEDREVEVGVGGGGLALGATTGGPPVPR